MTHGPDKISKILSWSGDEVRRWLWSFLRQPTATNPAARQLDRTLHHVELSIVPPSCSQLGYLLHVVRIPPLILMAATHDFESALKRCMDRPVSQLGGSCSVGSAHL